MTGSGSRPKPPARGAAGPRAQTGATSGEPLDVAELSYTEASRELDAIVEYFEQREVDVDQLVTRLERATAIVDELDRRLRQTRMQVEELVPRLEAASREVAAPPSAGPDGHDDEGSGTPGTGASRGEGPSQGAGGNDQDDEAELEEDSLEADLEVWEEEPADDSDQPLF